MKAEIWKIVKKTNKNLYEVSNLGRTRVNGVIKEHKSEGYYKFAGNRLHRWVAELFIPNTEHLPMVDHIDTNIHNNSVDNLHWVTAKGNMNNPLTRQRISVSMKGKTPWMKGKHHSDEAKHKLSDAHKGKKASEETKQKLSDASKNNWNNHEYRQKVSEAVKIALNKPETKQKLSDARKGEKNHFFGKHHSEETKIKLRKPKTKYLWLTENGEQIWMSPAHVAMHHKNWKLINKK